MKRSTLLLGNKISWTYSLTSTKKSNLIVQFEFKKRVILKPTIIGCSAMVRWKNFKLGSTKMKRLGTNLWRGMNRIQSKWMRPISSFNHKTIAQKKLRSCNSAAFTTIKIQIPRFLSRKEGTWVECLFGERCFHSVGDNFSIGFARQFTRKNPHYFAHVLRSWRARLSNRSVHFSLDFVVRQHFG